MAVFGQKVEPFSTMSTPANKEQETIIGPSVRVDGNFRGQGDVVIEGELHGSVKTDKNLIVGKNAHISANASAANAKISGEVRGSLKIKGKLELTESAKIFGDVETEILSVAPGAILHGKCTMVRDVPHASDAIKASAEGIAVKKKLSK